MNDTNISVDDTRYANAKSGLHVVQHNETRELYLRLERGFDPALIVGLWQVILTKKRQSKEGTPLTPVTTMALVIAEDKDGAISQVSSSGDSGWYDTKEALKSGDLTAEAYRVPLHIRGWGTTTF